MHFERPFQNRLDASLATFDLASIARGYSTLDAIVKRATVKVELAKPVSPGRFVIAISGDIAEVEESYAAGLSVAGSGILDHIFLARPHERLFARTNGGASALICEFDTVSSTIMAADLALKNTEVSLGTMRLADGLGGKGFIVLQGELCEIEEAMLVLKREIISERVVALELIAAPHAEICGFF
jgi:microcompartment protein CcmL/EutN